MTSSLQRDWPRLQKWIESWAPMATHVLRPPLGSAALTELKSRSASSWPEQIAEWYQLTDGSTEHGQAMVFPGNYTPMPAETMVQTMTDLDDIYRATRESMGLELGEAGAPLGLYATEYFPFASGGNGTFLMVDNRPGQNHGCVIEWLNEDTDLNGPAWPSLAVLVAEIVGSLEFSSPIHGWRIPLESDYGISWRFVG